MLRELGYGAPVILLRGDTLQESSNPLHEPGLPLVDRRVTARWAAHQVAASMERAGLAGEVRRRVESVSAQRAAELSHHHCPHPVACNTRLSAPPTRNASGKISAVSVAAV